MFQGIFKSALNDANKNYIFGTGSIPIQIKTAQLATFADGTTKQQGYQVAEVNKLISTMLTGWDANGNKPKSMSDNYLELILSCDNGFVVNKKLQFPHIIAWQNNDTPYNIADVYKPFSLDNWLKADDFENPDITLVVEPTDEILTTSTATPPEVTTTNSGRFYLYYRNLPVGVNRIHIDFHIKTKTEPIDFDLEIADGLSWKDAQTILTSNEQAKINVLLSGVKDVYKFTGAEGNFNEITMHEWSLLYQQIINLKPNNKFTHDLYFYIYDESEISTKIIELKQDVSSIEKDINGEYEESEERIMPKTVDGYYNTVNAEVGSTYNPPDMSYVYGFKGIKLSISEGETYHIKVSHGGAPEIRCYVITDINNIVTRLTTGSSLDDNITIQSGESNLFVNWSGYDESVDGLWRANRKEVYKGIKSSITDLNKNVFKLKNKTIVCFGDSITELKSNGKGYSDYISEFTGATVINVGVSGTRIQERETPSNTPYGTYQAYAAFDIVNMVKWSITRDFSILDSSDAYLNNQFTKKVTLLKSIDWSKVDIVTFLGGTNDFRTSDKLGTENSTDIKTTLGAINYIIENILTAYPHINIYWFTPIVRWIDANSLEERTPERWSDVWKNTENKTLVDYKNAIINIVTTVHHIPICDLYDGLGWNKYNFAKYFIDTDGAHPYKGFENIARKMLSFIIGNEI